MEQGGKELLGRVVLAQGTQQGSSRESAASSGLKCGDDGRWGEGERVVVEEGTASMQPQRVKGLAVEDREDDAVGAAHWRGGLALRRKAEEESVTKCGHLDVLACCVLPYAT